LKHNATSTSISTLLAGLMALTGCQNSPTAPRPLQTTPIAQSTPAPANPQPQAQPAAQLAKRNDAAPAPAPSSVVPSAVSSANDQVIARLAGEPITMGQIMPILVKGYGLNVLLNYVQLAYTKQEAERQHVVVTPEQIKGEVEYTLANQLFRDADKADYPRLLDQLLEQRHISRGEFDLVMETNAYLRQMATPLVKDKVTDEVLQQAFREIYGETVQVRHIELSGMEEVGEAQRRLAAGEPFEKVAREMSKNGHTAPLGGEIAPFSRSADYPQVFKDMAFNLKEGEVSTPINVEGSYQIIKLEKRIPPKAVKFEDVKESLREDILDRLVTAAMQQLRVQVANDARNALRVIDPVLKDQYDAKLTQRDQQIQNTNQMKQEWERRRDEILKNAATQESTTQPAMGTPINETSTPAAPVLSAPGVARPPATQSGAPGSGASDMPLVLPPLNK
jgi:parvulin-like peptidyl-prolyl isomerase